MENVKWTIVKVVTGNKWNKADTLTPKGVEVGYKSFLNFITNWQTLLGLKIAPKIFMF